MAEPKIAAERISDHEAVEMLVGMSRGQYERGSERLAVGFWIAAQRLARAIGAPIPSRPGACDARP